MNSESEANHEMRIEGTLIIDVLVCAGDEGVGETLSPVARSPYTVALLLLCDVGYQA